jgi:hypothetical protein
MATNYITTPASNNTGIIIGFTALIVLGLLFLYFGVPAIRNMNTSQMNTPSPVINLPGEIDVTVNQSE